MKIRSVACIVFAFCMILSCKNTIQKDDNDSAGATEKARLTSIVVGSYSLTIENMAEAETNAGFRHKFPKNFENPCKIAVIKEDGASVTFDPLGSESVTLTREDKTIIITVKKSGKLNGVYKLILSKEDESSPPNPQALPFDDIVDVCNQELSIVGRTFNRDDLKWDGVFLNGRTVKLSPFSIGKYELTYKIWYTVADWAKAHGYKFTGEAKEGSKTAIPDREPQTDNLPVTQVNWHDVIVWCNAYTEMRKGESDCVYREANASGAVLKDASNKELYKKVFWDKTKKGYRLPTEAEWEYVARYQKDNSNDYGREYGKDVWLTKIDAVSGATKNYKDVEVTAKYCWWTSNKAEQMPKAVGSKEANHLGVHDMSGNMMEWVYDWYAISEEKTEIVENPEGPALSTLSEDALQKVMKGGAYNSIALVQCLPAYRNGRRSVLNAGDSMDSGVRLAIYK